MAGLIMRQHAKGAVPLLVGDGSTVRDIIGSIRQLKVIDRQLFGSIMFASDPAAKAVAAKWQDGHVDVSNLVLDFQVEQGTKIPKGTSNTMLLESNHRLANGVPCFWSRFGTSIYTRV